MKLNAHTESAGFKIEQIWRVGPEAREEIVLVLTLPMGGGLSEDDLGGILEMEASWE